MKEHTNHATSSQPPQSLNVPTLVEKEKKIHILLRFPSGWKNPKIFIDDWLSGNSREIFRDEMNDNPVSTRHTPVSKIQLLFPPDRKKKRKRKNRWFIVDSYHGPLVWDLFSPPFFETNVILSYISARYITDCIEAKTCSRSSRSIPNKERVESNVEILSQ
jgi:hypothetical protein